jgi:hypothetical protein
MSVLFLRATILFYPERTHKTCVWRQAIVFCLCDLVTRSKLKHHPWLSKCHLLFSHHICFFLTCSPLGIDKFIKCCMHLTCVFILHIVQIYGSMKWNCCRYIFYRKLVNMELIFPLASLVLIVTQANVSCHENIVQTYLSYFLFSKLNILAFLCLQNVWKVHHRNFLSPFRVRFWLESYS